jgi:hypothetical protein
MGTVDLSLIGSDSDINNVSVAVMIGQERLYAAKLWRSDIFLLAAE